jgi:hypothetical protein
MGAVLATVRDLKASVDALKRKDPISENKEIKEILDTQKIVDEVIGAKRDAIKRIDEEIKQLVDKKVETKTNHNSDNSEEEPKDMVDKKKRKKCRYYDRGFCKYNIKCRCSHPEGKVERKLAVKKATWMVEDSTALHLPGIQLMGAPVTKV